MDGTNTYMPVMPAGYGGMGDMGGAWWLILLFLFMGFGGGDHGLKLRAGGNILETAAGVIRVFVHDGVPFPGGKGADVRQLLLDGYVTLAGGGVSRIRHRGARGAGGGGCFFHTDHQPSTPVMSSHLEKMPHRDISLKK